jgi:hypothetical protein
MLGCVEEAPREGDGSTIIVYVFALVPTYWLFQEEICIVCVVVVPGYGSKYVHQESRTQVSGAPPPITKRRLIRLTYPPPLKLVS